MHIELIPEAGRFYKVNLHCHTTVSDGKPPPEEVKESVCDKEVMWVCAPFTLFSEGRRVRSRSSRTET